MQKERAKNNRTLTLTENEIPALRKKLLTEENFSQDKKSFQDQKSGGLDLANKILNGDIFKMLPRVPDNFADLIIIDPPYNLSKNFGGLK